MAWIWPAATAAASVVGNLIGKSGQDDANQMNMVQAQQNRDFQERMSSSAYQRATADMKAAGLNPMLAYSQGGASTPTGGVGNPIVNPKAVFSNSGAQVAQAAQVANVVEDTRVKEATSANVAMDTRLKEAQVAETKEREQLHFWTASNQKEQGLLNIVRGALTRQQVDLTNHQIELIKENVRNAVKSGKKIDADTARQIVETTLAQLEIPAARNASQHQIKYPSYNIDVKPFVNDVGSALHSGAAVARAVRGFRGPGSVERSRSYAPDGKSYDEYTRYGK